MAKDEIVFTDLDLDGAGSYLVHCWAQQKKPNVVTLKVSNLREKFLKLLKFMRNKKRIKILSLIKPQT